MDGAAAPLTALPASGGRRALVERTLAAIAAGERGVLGLVVATEGSTYAKAGAALLFGDDDLRRGWISGGCLEPGLEREAAQVGESGLARLVELDTRSDADLFFGSRIGCRGLLRVALLPLAQLAAIAPVLAAWTTRHHALDLAIGPASADARCDGVQAQAALAWQPDTALAPNGWPLHWPAAPRLLLFGAGPETPVLLPWLQQLGWYVDLVERRPRWRHEAAKADRHVEATPAALPAGVAASGHDAALVMHHDFELDRDALEALADTDVPFVGLLGPPARRDDLLALLDAAQRERLQPRLRAPVGLDLGGRGPEAIALAIVAQLQADVPAARLRD